MLLKAFCLHVLENGLQAFMFVACGLPWTIFVALFAEILHNVSENSVEMKSVVSLTRLVLLAFCMRFITGVGGI